MNYSKSLFLVITSVFYLNNASLNAQCVPINDSLALVALYNSTDGPNWTNNTNWLVPGQPIGTWFGVTTNVEGCVFYLILNNNHLVGSIPSALGNLSNLAVLSLDDNQLNGSIPPELGNLGNLSYLRLNNSQLNGSIPPELGNLVNLTDFYLFNNQLSASIPPELGNLVNLTGFYLSNNQLSGNIPPELSNLVNATRLSLGDNQLSGGIPPELGNLVNLTGLYLANNQLSGMLPLDLGNLVNLTELWLNNNQLNGCFPSNFNTFCGIDYNFINNPLLPWQGDFSHFCNGEPQTSAPCDDGNPLTTNDVIQADCSCQGSCVQTDSLALVALYNATDGDNWTTKTNWLVSGQPIGTWYGVTANAQGCVTCLDLDGNPNCNNSGNGGNNLSGVIPSELGNLQYLSILVLNGNQLGGTIPPELGNLQNLISLHISANNLSGSIPLELGNLQNLTALYLNSNEFNGNIPPELGNLQNLNILYLSGNELNGSIPPELGNLQNLTSLYLFGNNLEGSIPLQLGNLQNVVNFHLHDNQLSGAIPPELGNLQNLEQLRLSDNKLSGSIPSELGNLQNLTSLRLSSNQLSGCYPTELLSHCDIVYNLNNNPLLPWQGDFSHFCDGGPQIGAPCNDSNPNTTNDLIQMDCTCQGAMNACAQSDSLSLVALYNASGGLNWTNNTNWLVSGQPIGTWYGVTANAQGCVTCLDLDGVLGCDGNFNLNGGNNLIGIIPSEVGNLESLQALHLRHNQLSGNIPPELGNLLNLEWLGLGENDLSGTIPPPLGDLQNLKHLALYYNDLSGTIPPELGNLQNLINLNISSNNLMGSIPAELGNLQSLEHLFLQDNELAGSIPSTLGNLQNLYNLYLDDNKLIGAIPSALGNLQNLHALQIRNNQLSGSIPPALGNLQNLEFLWLRNNQLSGCYPPELLAHCDISCIFNNNPLLPWEGESLSFYNNFCNGAPQTGAPCDDGDPLTENDIIQSDCTCKGETTLPCTPSGFPVAGDSCTQAPLLCSGIDGYCGTLDTSSASQPFPGCSNWVLNNDEWIAFVAGSSTISVQITPWNCSSSNTPGLQAGIYKSCISEIIDLQCSPTTDPFVLQSSDFLVGQKYYLVFDGGDNSTCGYTVDVLQGSTVALSADLPDTTICSGDTIAPSISGGTLSNLFLWNTGETSASIVPANAGIYTVTITDSNGCTVVESATIGVEPQPCNNNCPPPGFSLPGDSCTQAPVMCNGIDGYCGTLDSIGIIQNFPDCFGGSLYNDEWIAFVAGDTLISIEVTPSDCQAPSGLPGMQGAIYEGSCDGNTIATQCDGTTDPFLLTAASFVPGKVYYLVLDGLIDSYCDYSIKVLSGSTAPVPPQAPDGPYGTADVCPGATVTYSLGNPNAAIINWTLSPPGIGTFIPPVQGGQVDIFWSMEGTAQLCVTASNPCANPSPPSCITIEAKNISTSTEFHQLYLGDCVECAGQTFCAPGTYPVTLESWLGCDSTIICEISAACTDQFAGTISFANFTGQSNDIDLDTIYLCYNDAIDIIHNGDANLTGDPNPVTQPGITYGFFDCPPTISGYNLTNILSDPCILDTPPPANGIWVASGGSPSGYIDFFNNGILQNLFNNGDPELIWFAPMTIDNFSIKGFENNPLPPFNLGPCVNVSVDEAFAVVYLNEIEVSSLQLDNFGCGGSFTLKGGLPEFDGSAYEIAIYQQANPAIQGQVFTNNPTHGQSVSFSVPAPGIYEVFVEDGKSCKVNMEVTVNCNCISSAGTMDLTPIISCASQTVTAIYDDTGEVYDPDDTLYFYLHEGSGNTLVNPISFSGTPTFSFQPGMSYGVTYYISAVVGSWAGNGVDLTDPCLSVAPGTPVVFTTGLNGAALSAPDTICAGSEALLVASGGDTYTWNVSGATVSSLPYYPQTSGTVSVTISDSATGCDTTISHFIFVKSVASVQIGCDNPLCVGDKDTLCTSGSAVAFLWNDGSVQQTLLVQPTATTQYWVTGFKPNHCPGSDSVTIVVAQPPVADAGGDQITCTDAAMLQTSPPPGALLEWFDLTGAFVENPDAASTPVHDLMPGENLFQLTVQTPPCPGEALDTVTVFYANEAAQVMDDQSHTNLNTVLEMNVLANDGLSAALTYELRLIEQDDNGTWQLSSNGVLNFEPTSGFSGIAAARYEVCNTACDTVCGEAAITIKVLKPEDDIGETQVITPNGDGKNDELIFDYLDQYPDNSIVIFNRWGDVVFQHKPYENDWVGTYNGGALPTGTYYYVLNLKGDDNLIWGNVLLIR